MDLRGPLRRSVGCAGGDPRDGRVSGQGPVSRDLDGHRRSVVPDLSAPAATAARCLPAGRRGCDLPQNFHPGRFLSGPDHRHRSAVADGRDRHDRFGRGCRRRRSRRLCDPGHEPSAEARDDLARGGTGGGVRVVRPARRIGLCSGFSGSAGGRPLVVGGGRDRNGRRHRWALGVVGGRPRCPTHWSAE